MELRYVGLDLHMKNTFGTIMDGGGVVLRQGKFPTTEDDLRSFLEGVDEARIALEASGFCLPWVEFLEGLGHRGVCGPSCEGQGDSRGKDQDGQDRQ